MRRSTCSPSGTAGVVLSAAPVERPAQPLPPADQLGHRAGAGEVKPVGRADI
jgi:hypothetical protein